MDSAARTRVVISTSAEVVIRSFPANGSRFWVFRNLGPAKIVVIGNHQTESTNNELRAGDYVEIDCISAEVKLAQGESWD
jgi:hypothetical protein